ATLVRSPANGTATVDQLMDGPPETIGCVDCLGRCHRLTAEPVDGFEPGDVIAYRCEDCGDRWDVVWEPDERE
ncbi:MAG: hypothetical protein AB1Z55_00400, partial [Acidimicrobiia bacterium]